MFSLMGAIVDNIINFFITVANLISFDLVFIIALAVEVLFVIFFLIKSAFSYEAALNRALDRLNYWLFEKKVVTEENIKDLNVLFKTKTPKRLCYYWQQYILFREGAPSSYMSSENLVEKPLKTSSYNSNIKNLTIFTTLWAFIAAMFVILCSNAENVLYGRSLAMALLVPIFIAIIGVIFVVYLRARKNSTLNSLYQNVALFGRFMDNACVDLPSYIDYQILFTPAEIEKGQPVLREFLDYKARKEKEEFQKAKENEITYEQYDFSSTGIDGSIVLDRAMKESELFLNKKEKILVKISQLEAELDSRRKNFDNVQKDYQTKIQASKENVNRLRQMQEETTNRIESNYYRKQQTQEIGKQEQFEQEFEQLRAKYLLEKKDGEDEIKKLNDELAQQKKNIEQAMLGEYQTFFNKFCQSAEKVVGTVFKEKIDNLNAENEKNKQLVTELEIQLKNVPQGAYDGAKDKTEEIPAEGKYDDEGNYIYPNGTFYDKDGNFHDENGNVYSQDGTLIQAAPTQEEEKKVVDLNNLEPFDYMTDVSQKDAVYDVAKNVVEDIDKDNSIEFVESEKPAEQQTEQPQEVEQPAEEEKAEKTKAQEPEKEPETANAETQSEVQATETKPKKKAGRPRKVVTETEPKEPKKRGRPRKTTTEPAKTEPKKVGRPKKVVTEPEKPKEKRKVGRPKKIVKEQAETEKVKRGRGRPKKQNQAISEINKKLSEEEKKISEMRSSINQELEKAMNDMNSSKVDDKQARREQLLKEIDALQKEAIDAMARHESETRIAEINSKLESILEEIKKLNS